MIPANLSKEGKCAAQRSHRLPFSLIVKKGTLFHLSSPPPIRFCSLLKLIMTLKLMAVCNLDWLICIFVLLVTVLVCNLFLITVTVNY